MFCGVKVSMSSIRLYPVPELFSIPQSVFLADIRLTPFSGQMMPFFLRDIFKGTKPKYGRYLAEGTVTYTDSEQTFTETSDLIYEFAYIGEEYKKFMEQSM